MPAMLSYNERLDRMKRLATGFPEKSRRAKRSSVPQEALVARRTLLGVSLRAASRRSKGQELSDLEKLLLQTLSCVAENDEELEEYGKIFDETADSGRRSAAVAFPKSIIESPADAPYTVEDLVRDTEAQKSVFEQVPNVRFMEMKSLADGPASFGSGPIDWEKIDWEKIVDTIQQYFGASSIYCYDKSIDHEAEQPNMRYKIRMVKFYTLEASGDSFLAPKDELRWTCVSATEAGTNKEFKTDEFGSIKDKTTTKFKAGTYLFDGYVKGHVCCDLQLWEMDDEPGDWSTKLGQALEQIGGLLSGFARLAGNIPGAKQAAVWVDVAGQILGLAEDIIDFFRNDHDFVCERQFDFHRDILLQWAGKTKDFYFDGGGNGRHLLTLSFERV